MFTFIWCRQTLILVWMNPLYGWELIRVKLGVPFSETPLVISPPSPMLQEFTGFLPFLQDFYGISAKSRKIPVKSHEHASIN